MKKPLAYQRHFIIFCIITGLTSFVFGGCDDDDDGPISLLSEPIKVQMEAPTPPSSNPIQTDDPFSTLDPTSDSFQTYSDIDAKYEVISHDCLNGRAVTVGINLIVSGGKPPYRFEPMLPYYAQPGEYVIIFIYSDTPDGNPSGKIEFIAPTDNDDQIMCVDDSNGPDIDNSTETEESCTEHEIQSCKDEVTSIVVCVKWPPGNPNNCLEWGKQDIISTVCTTELVCE